MIYKPGPDLNIADWLFRNSHPEDTNQEITGMNINTSAISTVVNMPVCTSIEDKQMVLHEDGHLQKLKSYIIQSWSQKR